MIIFFACVCLLTMLVTIVGYMFYRLRKRDEGSYQVGIKAWWTEGKKDKPQKFFVQYLNLIENDIKMKSREIITDTINT